MRPHPPPPGHVQRYGYGRKLDLPFATTLERTRAALRREGFGILYEIDLRAVLQSKLGVDFREYVLLGASNPLVAHRALLLDIDVGLLLPCNFIVYAHSDGGTMVHTIDAVQTLSVTGSELLESLGGELDERLRKVIDEL